jgi:hypothetical protein
MRLNSCSSVFCNILSLRTIYLCESHLVCGYICRDSYESATLVRTSRFVVHFCPCNLQLHSLYQTQIWYLQTRTSPPDTLVWVFFFVHSLSLPYNLQFQHLYQNTNLKVIYVCLFVNMPHVEPRTLRWGVISYQLVPGRSPLHSCIGPPIPMRTIHVLDGHSLVAGLIHTRSISEWPSSLNIRYERDLISKIEFAIPKNSRFLSES